MSSLFSPYDLSATPLKNRVVMAPMTRSRNADTIAKDITALYYSQRASAGLIVTEGSQFSRQGVGYPSPSRQTPKQPDEALLYRVHTAQAKLGVSRSTIYRLVNEGAHKNREAFQRHHCRECSCAD